jgi:multiple sugar transport system permease protein
MDDMSRIETDDATVISVATEKTPAQEDRKSGSSMVPRRRGGGGPGRTKRRRRASQERRFAWALIAPAAIVMVLIHLIPTAAGIYVSFLKLNTFTLQELFGAPWIGFDNYDAILFDDSNPLHNGFTNAAGNTVVYTAAVVIGTIGGGLIVALLLNREFPGVRAVRALMLTPWIIPSFVVATLFQFMLQKDAGIVNKVLVDYTHMVDERPTWLIGDNTMWAIVIPSIWRGLPLPMLFFLAGLQAIPKELHEAAKMDGANAWRRFREITLPLLRPLIAIQLLFGVIYAAYMFTIPYIMLGSNPGDDADLIMTLIVRQSFENSLFGFGAAVSTLLMIAMAVWVAVWYFAFRKDMEAVTR